MHITHYPILILWGHQCLSSIDTIALNVDVKYYGQLHQTIPSLFYTGASKIIINLLYQKCRYLVIIGQFVFGVIVAEPFDVAATDCVTTSAVNDGIIW